jgi:hypothetical protein
MSLFFAAVDSGLGSFDAGVISVVNQTSGSFFFFRHGTNESHLVYKSS